MVFSGEEELECEICVDWTQLEKVSVEIFGVCFRSSADVDVYLEYCTSVIPSLRFLHSRENILKSIFSTILLFY